MALAELHLPVGARCSGGPCAAGENKKRHVVGSDYENQARERVRGLPGNSLRAATSWGTQIRGKIAISGIGELYSFSRFGASRV